MKYNTMHMKAHEMQSTGSRIWAWMAGVSILLIAFGVGVLLFWAFANENVLEVKNSPFPTRVIANTTDRYIVLDTEYCKNSGIQGKLRMSFVSDTQEVFLPVVDEKLPKGCSENSIPIAIPKSLQAGNYIVKFRATYNINPLKQNITTEFESRKFELK